MRAFLVPSLSSATPMRKDVAVPDRPWRSVDLDGPPPEAGPAAESVGDNEEPWGETRSAF